MAAATSKLVWLNQLICDMKISCGPMQMYCNNQVARLVASNPMFHEKSKHIETDCHLIRENVQAREIKTPFVRSQNNLTEIFTKALDKGMLQNILYKFGSIKIFKPNLRESAEKYKLCLRKSSFTV